jgi:hypothetical protein
MESKVNEMTAGMTDHGGVISEAVTTVFSPVIRTVTALVRDKAYPADTTTNNVNIAAALSDLNSRFDAAQFEDDMGWENHLAAAMASNAAQSSQRNN